MTGSQKHGAFRVGVLHLFQSDDFLFREDFDRIMPRVMEGLD